MIKLLAKSVTLIQVFGGLQDSWYERTLKAIIALLLQNKYMFLFKESWYIFKIVARYQRRYLFRTNFFFLLAQVGTCLRVQELKILCFYLLSFQGYEAKTNDDSSFSQFSRIFSKLTIAHCVFMVPPSAFIFSGIVRIMETPFLSFETLKFLPPGGSGYVCLLFSFGLF